MVRKFYTMARKFYTWYVNVIHGT